jgi:predicted nucleic acid-binding protein
MSVEFVDTNVLVYAHDGGAGTKHGRSVELLARLFGEAEAVIADLGSWMIHRPGHADRRYKVAWWDAMIVNSAIEAGCSILWSEDLSDGQRYGPGTVRNPFR